MLTSETKRRIDACRNVLVGKLPLPTDQVELITLALIYKFMDDLDEEAVRLGGKRSFFTGALEKYRWRNLLPQTLSAVDRFRLFEEGFKKLAASETLPPVFRSIFKNARLKLDLDDDSPRILALFVAELNGLAYSHSEELGNAFEYLLMKMGTQGENGQFRTPRHIIDFMVACLDPKPGERILDPACGTGGFLVSAYKHILASHTSPGSSTLGDKLTHTQRQKVYGSITGYDNTPLMVKLSKVNLFLHDFPDPAVHGYDTLSNDARWGEKADVVLANPPFMTPKGGVTPHTKFRIAAKKAEVLFTDYIAEHLAADGRAAVIVPNGIVATVQNAYIKLRRFLVEDSLVAVVSLPSGVFKPYSGVKTSILLLDKKLAQHLREIVFLKIDADGFDLGDQRRPVEANDLPEAERLVKLWLAGKLNATVETSLSWRAVERTEVLGQRACSLQAEIFLGNKVTSTSADMVALGEVASLCNGGTPSKSNPEFWRGDIPWVSPKDMKTLVLADTEDHVSLDAINSSATKLLPAGTVLVVVRSGILQHTLPVAITSRPMCTNQDILAIAPDRARLDPHYLMFVLKGRSGVILRDGIKTGVTVQSFHNGYFKTFEIPLPPMGEQLRIVAEVQGYQTIIDGARQIVAAYSPRLTFRPDWPMVKLGDICEIVRGSSPRPQGDPRYFGGPVPRLMIADITRDGMWVTPQIDSLTEEGAKHSRPMKAGDVVMAVSASPGLPALLKVDACIHDGFAGLKGIPKTLDRTFLYYVLMELRAEHDSQAAGATFRNITTDQIRAFEIPLPPLEDQLRIVAALDAEAAQIDAVRSMIAQFALKIQHALDRVWGDAREE